MVFFAKNEHYSNEEGTGVIWISDFINKFYSNVVNLKKSKVTENNLKKYTVKYGDALFCRSSLTKEGIGKCAIIPENLTEDILFECHIIRIRFNNKFVIPEFFRMLSNTRYFRFQIEKYSKTSTMTTISQEGILEAEIIIPPLHKQIEYKKIVNKIFEEKKKLETSLAELENNFNSIMQRAFKGELF